MAKKQKKAAAGFESTPFHLADLIGAVFASTREIIRPPHRAGESGAEKFPKATVHDEVVQTHLHNTLVKVGGISGEQFRKYAALAGLGSSFYAVGRSVVQPSDDDISDHAAFARRVALPPGGDNGEPEVCAAIARLDREGWTVRLLADIWKKWPAVAEARGLPRRELTDEESEQLKDTYDWLCDSLNQLNETAEETNRRRENEERDKEYFQRQEARLRRLEEGKADAASAEPTGREPEADDDGRPFYKPAHFKKWSIGDELLRRNKNDKRGYIEGKVRRRLMNSPRRKKKRPVYWYSEPDARNRWPDRFAAAENPPQRA